MSRKAIRSDGRYQVSIVLGRDKSGKLLRKYFYGKTQKEANAKKKAYMDGLQLAPDAAIITLGKWCRMWLEIYASGGVRNKANNASILRRFCESVGGQRKLLEIKPAHVQAYARSQTKFTKSHVDKVRRTLGNAFKAAVDNGYISKSPCDGIVWESVRTGSHKMLEPYLVDLITDNWQVHPAGIWAMLMLYAGLRPSEAFALRRENITDTSIIVTDGSHYEHGQLVIVAGQVKSDAGQREIPILPPIRGVIEALPDQGLVCLSTSGKPVSEAACRANWRALWNALEDVYNECPPRGAGRRSDRLPENWKYLPKVQMYDLRHTFCSLLYDADVDVKTAQYLMGHSSLEITLKIYTHLSEKKKQRSYDKLMEYFEK